MMSQQDPFGSPQNNPQNNPYQQPGGYPPGQAPMVQPQSGKSGSGILKIILIVGGIMGVLMLVCCGGCIMLMNVGGNALADSARQNYSTHPDVVEHIGEDATFSWSIMEAAKAGQDGGDQKQAFKVSGSKGSGVILARQAGQSVSDGVLVLPDGTEYQLD